MSEATRQALEQFVQKMLAGAEQAGQFAVEQTPLLVQEWLRWQIVNAAMWGTTALVLLCAGIYGFRFGAKYQKKDRDDDAGDWAMVMGCVVAFLSIIGGVLPSVWAITKVLVAPKVVILEKFMDLVK